MRLRSVTRWDSLARVVGGTRNRQTRPIKFDNSSDYWERRYRSGGTSGAGSRKRLGEFKAEFLNEFVVRHDVRSVIEFGCGDGEQLKLARYPLYIGLDVSRTAISMIGRRFAGDRSKEFYCLSEAPSGLAAELALSLDVIFHLVEDWAFDSHIRSLFAAASRYVIIYSSNIDCVGPALHIRHRRFTRWIEEKQTQFELLMHLPNPFPFAESQPDDTSFSDFYVFQRSGFRQDRASVA
jgi:hypothetical protein